MVSSSKSPNGKVACPALGQEITTKQCASERISAVSCPLNCPRNPFNPSSVEEFDRVIARGLELGMKWVEETIGTPAMAKSLKSMDRRFNPEADLAIVTYENMWKVLNQSRLGLKHPQLWEGLKGEEGKELRNETRVFLEKLESSRALLLEVLDTPKDLPYYRVRDLINKEKEYLYVDFGVQDPLYAGEVLFGRFMTHENCLYVLPGIFVGSARMAPEAATAVLEFMETDHATGGDVLQKFLPEVWELLEELEFDLRELEGELSGTSVSGDLRQENMYRARVALPKDKSLVVESLRCCDILKEEKESELEVSFVDKTIFNIVVVPPLPRDEGVDFIEMSDDQEKPLTIGSVVVTESELTISGENPVELELVRALVEALLQGN